MNIGTWVEIILTILGLIPKAKEWFDDLVAAYVQMKIDQMKKENKEAIKNALRDYDQREIEKAIGNPNPGEPTKHEGAEIVDELPNVPKRSGV